MPADTEPDALQALLARLTRRDAIRAEANVQADVRQLLLTADLGLDDHDLTVELETQVGDRRRIDVEVGLTVIEVKRDLRKAGVVRAAETQLAGYVAKRGEQTGGRYVGVLTDGVEWRAYHLHDDRLAEATRFEFVSSRSDAGALVTWLQGVLATRHNVPPTPTEIARQLGESSASYALDRATLAALYRKHAKMPTVMLKRRLWASLLRSALGTQFTDDDELFVEHTLLVNSAEVIAHLIIGLDVNNIRPATLLSGARFASARVYGVVEQDFFDWTLEVPGGEAFIRALARRISRFDWHNVEHDVLKVLYQSVIGAETRKKLGEYYTPDWLAEQIVTTAVTDPLSQRVLDPACGSGTFLFHAVRRHLEAADSAGIGVAQALQSLGAHVLGVDLHPVAVALARVTYLLAIGTSRLLDPKRGSITVPVYLGDSIQWRQRVDLFTEGHLVVDAGSSGTLWGDELRIPEPLLADAGRFDQVVTEITRLAAKPRVAGTVPSLTGLLNRLAIPEQYQPTIKATFEVLCRLHDEGRDHIWSYYLRNLSRPVWLAMPDNRVDVIVGNPPWLSFRSMPADMQATFKAMSTSRGLWAGGKAATHQDLSALFLARAIQLYLKQGGSFACVMPNAVLDRDYYAGFRDGSYPDVIEPATVAFTGSWDLRRLRPHFFPRAAAVVFGDRTESRTGPLPAATTRWSGQLPRGKDGWTSVASSITREEARLAFGADHLETSPYGPRFSAGATIFPKVLFFVEERTAGPLGLGEGRVPVRSERSANEKPPWKHLPPLEGVVEAEFVHPVLLGESVLPYRVLPARRAVLPLEGDGLLDGASDRIDLYPDLADWWRKGEETWLANRSSDRLALIERLDFRRGMTQQRPAPALRLLYGASGMHVCAAVTDDRNAVIEHKLYWGMVSSHDEGMYLCAILNSPIVTELVRPLMSYGKDERDIDKYIWKLPIPLYDPAVAEHVRLAQLGAMQQRLVAQLELDEKANYVKLRRTVRAALAEHAAAGEIDALVSDLLE